MQPGFIEIHSPSDETSRQSGCSVVVLRQERVRYLLAAVDGADDDEECAAHHDETEGSGCVVSFFVYSFSSHGGILVWFFYSYISSLMGWVRASVCPLFIADGKGG